MKIQVKGQSVGMPYDQWCLFEGADEVGINVMLLGTYGRTRVTLYDLCGFQIGDTLLVRSQVTNCEYVQTPLKGHTVFKVKADAIGRPGDAWCQMDEAGREFIHVMVPGEESSSLIKIPEIVGLQLGRWQIGIEVLWTVDRSDLQRRDA